MATKQKQSRDRETGRYGFDGKWDRLCTCGHTLGDHLAQAPHYCIAGDFHKGVECNCLRFTPKKEK
jgi:hypothetical protein